MGKANEMMILTRHCARRKREGMSVKHEKSSSLVSGSWLVSMVLVGIDGSCSGGATCL